MTYSRWLSACLLLLLPCLLLAQYSVSGTVKDATGEPLVGVSVLVVGTTTGAVTDFEGNFELDIPDDRNELRLSYTGFAPQVIEVSYRGDILRARLRVAGSENFVMKMRNTIGQTHLHAGQSVRIGWHPEDARALDPV